MQLEATHEIMGQDGELLPGSIGAVVIGGIYIEGKLALGFGEGLFPRRHGGDEVLQGLSAKFP